MNEIRKLYLFTFFRSFTVFASVSVAFYNSNGLSYFEIMLLQSVYAVAIAVLEVPSGMLSDMIGRKKTLVVGSLAFAIAYSCGAFGAGLLMFGLMQIFAAVGQSCYSGTFLALMYEDVEHDKSITKSPNVIFSNLQVINLVSVLLAALTSVIVVKYMSMRATYFITVFMYLLTFAVSLGLKEKQHTYVKKDSYSLKGYFSIFREGIQTIAKSGFQILLIDMIVFVCFSNVVLYLQQPLLLDRAFPVAYFGIVSVIVTITTTVALKVFGALEKRIKQPKRLLSILTMAVIAVLLSNIVIKNSFWVIMTFSVLAIVMRVREIFIMTEVNRQISDSSRATILSIVSAVEMIGIAVLSAVIGYCENISLDFSIVVISLAMLSFYCAIWFRKRKYGGL